MNNIVHEWYKENENVNEMVQWNQGKLKKWEQSVVKSFPPKATILDIGCGMGREAFALADMKYSVVGIDITEEIINQVTQLSLQKGYNIPFLLYDGYSLPFEDASFDVVIIWAQTFGLLYGEENKQKFLKECRRVLKKDGLLSFSGHDYKYLKEQCRKYIVDRKFYPYSGAEIYWEAFLPEELSDYAENAGFSVVFNGEGEIYKPEDGVVLHCLCRK